MLSISDICAEVNNHSKRRLINPDKINNTVFYNLANQYISSLSFSNFYEPNFNSNFSEKLEAAIIKAANHSTYSTISENADENNNEFQNFQSTNLTDLKTQKAKSDMQIWKSVLNSKDGKKLWNRIDYKGKLNNDNIHSEH